MRTQHAITSFPKIGMAFAAIHPAPMTASLQSSLIGSAANHTGEGVRFLSYC